MLWLLYAPCLYYLLKLFQHTACKNPVLGTTDEPENKIGKQQLRAGVTIPRLDIKRITIDVSKVTTDTALLSEPQRADRRIKVTNIVLTF